MNSMFDGGAVEDGDIMMPKKLSTMDADEGYSLLWTPVNS